MIEEVNYLDPTCTEAIACVGHDIDSGCPPIECTGEHHLGEMSTSEEVHLYLLSIGERLRQYVAEVSHRFDLTPQQSMVMDRLVTRHSMGQLADGLACDPSNVTGIIRRLEQRGLVARVADEADRRTKWLSLTEAGLQLRADYRREVLQGSDVLTGMDAAQQQQLLDALRVVVANLGARTPSCT